MQRRRRRRKAKREGGKEEEKGKGEISPKHKKSLWIECQRWKYLNLIHVPSIHGE